MMRWMEQCAFVAASRVCRGGYMLTATMDSISFLKPTRVGDTVYIEGQVGACWQANMIGLRLANSEQSPGSTATSAGA